jgi:hypothetical protein
MISLAAFSNLGQSAQRRKIGKSHLRKIWSVAGAALTFLVLCEVGQKRATPQENIAKVREGRGRSEDRSHRAQRGATGRNKKILFASGD